MENKSSSTGLGVLSVIQIILIIAKVFGFWKVSWVIVLIPLWIEVGIIVLILLVWIVAYAVALVIERKNK